MPKAVATSSSSSEEDLTAFQSVAVSFEDITSQSKAIAEQAKRRVAGSRKRSRQSEQQHAGDAGAAPGEQDGGGEDEAGPSDYLTPVQTQVAAALDSLLGGQLRVKLPGPKRLRREAEAAGQAEAAETAAQAADGAFRFFARVLPGLAAVLEPEELPLVKGGNAFPDTFRRSRAPPGVQAAAALPALAVDGAALLAAAGTAWTGGSSANGGGGAGGGPGSQKKKKKKGVLGEGVVLEGRPFVPHEERMRRLVGAPGAAAEGVVC
ncbi:hypothetical protein TSOC_011337 [Tetrabaena socialis]|uniref:Uncharacterized protein n=1 Tax=Tetrabaena socialis TaxID=47790 RepID=A0A2J7ZQW8_9CHLO|nr:hypothetical protein TSOC_011337 [Tetrabaena socialis]|eukprot:PNH02662.1 hypothetical protein TSOC_011337 [Tetrabaena socialis]